MAIIQRLPGQKEPRTVMITLSEVFQTVSQKSLEFFSSPEGPFWEQKDHLTTAFTRAALFLSAYILGLLIISHSKKSVQLFHGAGDKTEMREVSRL